MAWFLQKYTKNVRERGFCLRGGKQGEVTVRQLSQEQPKGFGGALTSSGLSRPFLGAVLATEGFLG